MGLLRNPFRSFNIQDSNLQPLLLTLWIHRLRWRCIRNLVFVSSLLVMAILYSLHVQFDLLIRVTQGAFAVLAVFLARAWGGGRLTEIGARHRDRGGRCGRIFGECLLPLEFLSSFGVGLCFAPASSWISLWVCWPDGLVGGPARWLRGRTC